MTDPSRNPEGEPEEPGEDASGPAGKAAPAIDSGQPQDQSNTGSVAAQAPAHGAQGAPPGANPLSPEEVERARRMAMTAHLKAYQWPKGVSGYPAGRPTRKRFFEQVLTYSHEMAKQLNEEARSKGRKPMIDTDEEHGLAAFLFVRAMATGAWSPLKEYIDRFEGVLAVKVEDGGTLREHAAREFSRYVAMKTEKDAAFARAHSEATDAGGESVREEPRDVEIIQSMEDGGIDLDDDADDAQSKDHAALPFASPAHAESDPKPEQSADRSPTPEEIMESMRAPHSRTLRVEDIVASEDD